MSLTMSWNRGYSHKDMIDRALKIKIRRAITMVQGDNPNSDIAIQHPEWIRAAQNKNYVELTKYVTQKFNQHQEKTKMRRNKFAGQD